LRHRHAPPAIWQDFKRASPPRPLPDPVGAELKVVRRDRLGGLIHEYTQVA
jgi:putative transposase